MAVAILAASLAIGAGSASYRIILEALTNVSRHANARDCCVELSADGRELKIAVADDGVGLEADREAGLGLGSMRERSRRPSAAGCG